MTSFPPGLATARRARQLLETALPEAAAHLAEGMGAKDAWATALGLDEPKLASGQAKQSMASPGSTPIVVVPDDEPDDKKLDRLARAYIERHRRQGVSVPYRAALQAVASQANDRGIGPAPISFAKPLPAGSPDVGLASEQPQRRDFTESHRIQSLAKAHQKLVFSDIGIRAGEPGNTFREALDTVSRPEYKGALGEVPAPLPPCGSGLGWEWKGDAGGGWRGRGPSQGKTGYGEAQPPDAPTAGDGNSHAIVLQLGERIRASNEPVQRIVKDREVEEAMAKAYMAERFQQFGERIDYPTALRHVTRRSR